MCAEYVVNLDFLKQKRLEKGVSLMFMSEKLGFKNASSYMRYENGEYSLEANMLPILAEVLECDIQDFFYKPNL